MPPKSRKKKLEVKEDKKEEEAPKTEFKIIPVKEVDSEKDIAKRIYVKPEDRITDNVLRLPELARILAVRAEMYSKNQISFTNLTTQINEEQVAIKELKDRKCPLQLIRVIAKDKDGNEIAELFDVNEMTFPNVHALSDDA